MLLLTVVSCGQKLRLDFANADDLLGMDREIVFTTSIEDDIATKAMRCAERYGSDDPYGDNLEVDRIAYYKDDVRHQTGVMFSRVAPFSIYQEEAETKATATEVTSISTFNLVCTTGSAGSESQTWALSGTGVNTGKYWPATNPSYHFYASNAALTFNAAGCTVAATNTTDVVVCYKPSPTYASSNALGFTHIFGRIGNVTVQAGDGFSSSDITNVSVTVTPKTGGTYNLRTGAWSSVTTGSSTSIANSSPGTKNNGLYMVPGNYTISASWKCKGTSYNGSGTVTINAGEQRNITLKLSGELVYTIAGLEIQPCNAVISNSSHTLACQYDDWNHDSYGSINDWNVGSYYNYPSRFRYSAFPCASYGGYSDWRMMTQSDMQAIFNQSRTPKCTINGTTGCLWMKIRMSTSVSHCSYAGPYLTVLFPDGGNMTVSRKASTINGNNSGNTNFTTAQLNEYIAQGAVVFPHSGYVVGDWTFGGELGFYLSKTMDSSYENCYMAALYNESDLASLEWFYMYNAASIRLVRTH